MKVSESMKKFLLSLILPFAVIIAIRAALILQENNYRFSEEVAISISKLILLSLLCIAALAVLFFVYLNLRNKLRKKA